MFDSPSRNDDYCVQIALVTHGDTFLGRVSMKPFVATLVFVFSVDVAFAHSPLQQTSPADGDSLSRAPATITLTYQRGMRMTRIRWSRDDGDNGLIDLDGRSGFATKFSLPFTGQGRGVYTIEWRGLGDDGHPQSGVFAFTVE